jgi:coenzyme F420 hydrogenase subunit beta
VTTKSNCFARLQADVIEPGLCTHCGLCAGLSQGSVAMVETAQGPQPQGVNGAAHVPEIVYQACPGRGLNYPELNQSVFGRQPDNWLVGCYENVYIAYSDVPDVRRRGASGGVITQTLLYLLRQGLIDGAVVAKQGQPQPWEAEAIIAQTDAEILACSQSIYRPVPVNAALAQMENFDGRLAYVGLPDQVAALRKLQQLEHPAALKVDYVLGPYTGTNMYFESIMSYLRSNGIRDVEEITDLKYREGEWPGHLQIKTRSGKVLRAEKFYYNYLIPFYITRHTLLSVDFTNELTDISVGDAWSPRYEAERKGFSVTVARSKKGDDLLQQMATAGVLALEPVALDDAMAMHGHMIDFKKRGAFIRMNWRKAAGKPIPDYGYRPKHIPLSRKLVEVVLTLIFLGSGNPISRRIVEHIPINVIGPLFNTLRKSWKDASKPVKRKGLREVEFETWSSRDSVPETDSMLSRTRAEIGHWRRRDWTFEAVGAHWDATEDYDSINEETYSYFRRFIDGLRLSDIPDDSRVLDICSRTGNGTLYFHQHGRVGSAVCADVSENMGVVCRERLLSGGFDNFDWVYINDYDLPFENAEFDAVLCFETVEHLSRPERLVTELGRVIKPGGQMILTTPNVLWEPVHALAAITKFHHSEGPHRFVPYGRLLQMVRDAGFEIEHAETTVLVPGGPKWLVRLGEKIEARTKNSLMPVVGLRRVLICRKK